jgi:hypothetical protein
MIEIIIVAVILGLAPAAIAHSKGHDFFAWWLYGTVIWIVAMPHALVLAPDRTAIDQRNIATGALKKCPDCAEFIKAEAIKCRFCGRIFEPPKVAESFDRPWHGANIIPVELTTSWKEGLRRRDGLRVAKLTENGPLALAGLQRRDTILKINDAPVVGDVNWFNRAWSDRPEGAPFALLVWRKDTTFAVQVSDGHLLDKDQIAQTTTENPEAVTTPH